MRITNKTTFAEAVKILDVYGKTDIDALKHIDKPNTVGGRKTPVDLNHITMGELLALQSITPEVAMFRPLEILLHIDQRTAPRLPFIEVVGFVRWVSTEIERIAEMFSNIPTEITNEQRKAGVHKLNFGSFGLVDSYARRMGIVDHDYVLDCVPWIRVWQCMKNDAELAQYDKRYREVIMDKKQ